MFAPVHPSQAGWVVHHPVQRPLSHAMKKKFKRMIIATTAVVAGIAFTAAAASKISPPPARPAVDPGDYRTVTTALTTRIVKTNQQQRAGQTVHLGLLAGPDKRGRFVVEDVEMDSPAAKAGVKAGDLLTRAGGQAVKSAADLRDMLKSRSPGESLALKVERGSKTLDLTVTLGAASRPLQVSAQRTTLGVRLEDPKQGGGAEVVSIIVGSPAHKAGIQPGDHLAKLDGDPITSPGYVRERLDEKQPGQTVKLVLRRDGKEMEMEATLGIADSGAEQTQKNMWKKDVFRLAVITVEFPDAKHNPAISSNHWAEFFFSRGKYSETTNATGQNVFGSVNDYFHEVSASRLRIEGRIFPWYEVKGKRAEYVSGLAAGNKNIFFSEVLDALIKRDGTNALDNFDGIHFVYAGERFQTGDRGSLYWPHASQINFRKQSWRYFICPEGGKRMFDISTTCHELGHILGLPDLYARPENPGSEGLGIWCIMSNENGNGRPQHFSAWCKEQLGWLTPAVLDPTVKQKLILAPVEKSTNECFKVLARADGTEYFLLENRRKTGFDRILPGEGLLIWRVVNGKVILEESHGVEGPAGPRVFPTSVPFPSRANTAFTPYTTPSSRALLGGGLPVHITGIHALEDGRIAFNIGYEYE